MVTILMMSAKIAPLSLLKIKVFNFLELIPTFVEVTGKKLVEGLFGPHAE